MWVWRWELTPREAYRGFKFVRYTEANTPPKVGAKPWPIYGHPLLSHPGLTYRIGVSRITEVPYLCELRAEHPHLPVTGDRRTGVFVLDGDRAVGSYLYDGFVSTGTNSVAVDPYYRGRGIAAALARTWFEQTRRPASMPAEEMNIGGMGANLKAQIGICRWAIEQGREVPPRVRQQMETGEDEQYLRGLMAEVQRTGATAVVG